MQSLGITDERGLVIQRLEVDSNNNLTAAIFSNIETGEEVIMYNWPVPPLFLISFL